VAPAIRKNSGKERTQFKPGKSGNPSGRPKSAHFADEVREFLGEKSGDKTKLRLVLENLSKQKPEVLLHYAFGKPVESTTTINISNEVRVDTSAPPEKWGAAEIAAELKKLGVEPVTSRMNGNGHDGPVKIKARPA
jgi:hypothetical protein